MTKRCAICGDTTQVNVRLAWRRERDGKTVNVCCACAEAGRVNENSIDNFTTEDTLYTGGTQEISKRLTVSGGIKRSALNNTRSRTEKRHTI